MVASKFCIDIIKYFEGCELKAYKCQRGIWTIGYGNTYYPDKKRVKKGDIITKDKAEELLTILLPKYTSIVEKNIKIPLQQHEIDALVSFCYNAGFSGTLFSMINEKKPIKDICDWWRTHYITAGSKELAGLVKRRAVEAHLFETGELKF